MAMHRRIDEAMRNARKNEEELVDRREILDFYKVPDYEGEQEVEALAQSAPAEEWSGLHRLGADRAVWNMCGDAPLGQSMSCPVLPPLKIVRNTRPVKRRPGHDTLIPMSRPGLQPSALRRVQSMEKNLSSNGRQLQRQRDFLDQVIPPHNRAEARQARLLEAARAEPSFRTDTMCYRMKACATNAHKNAEELAERRELLDFFKVQDQENTGQTPVKAEPVEDVPPRWEAGPAGRVARFKQSVSERLLTMELRALYNARTTNIYRKQIDSILGRNTCMEDDAPATDMPDAADSIKERPLPQFPVAANGSLTKRLKASEQRVTYNARALSDRRAFLDEMRRIADSGARAAAAASE